MSVALPQNFGANYILYSYKGRILIPNPLYLLTMVDYFLFPPRLFYLGYNVCQLFSPHHGFLACKCNLVVPIHMFQQLDSPVGIGRSISFDMWKNIGKYLLRNRYVTFFIQ